MNETRKWIFHRISGVILAPLYTWLYISLISISAKGYSEAIYFLKDPLFVIITIIVFFVGFFHVKISNQKNIKINASKFITPEILCVIESKDEICHL